MGDDDQQEVSCQYSSLLLGDGGVQDPLRRDKAINRITALELRRTDFCHFRDLPGSIPWNWWRAGWYLRNNSSKPLKLSSWWAEHFSEKDPGVLTNRELNTKQQCGLVSEQPRASWVPKNTASRSREVNLSVAETYLECLSSAVFPTTRKIWIYWIKCSKGTPILLRGWSICYKMRQRELWLLSLEKKLRGSWKCKYTMGAVKKVKPGSFQQCPMTVQEAMNISWNTGNFAWLQENTFCYCECM